MVVFLWTVDAEGAALILLHEALIHQVPEDIGSALVVLHLRMQLLVLGLHGVEHGQLRRYLLLMFRLGLLLCLDLSRSPAALGPCLEHVVADALRN